MAKPDLLKWVSGDEAAKITDPGSSKKLAGFLYKEKPPFQYLNWFFNQIYKWFRGLQGNYFDVIIGSATQVTNLEATHVVTELDNTLAAAGTKILILAGTHTLTANISLSNVDIQLIAESSEAIIDVATFTLTLSGARTNSKLRIINAGAGDIIISGEGSKFSGLDIALSSFAVSGGAIIETTGDNGLSSNEILPPITTGSGSAYIAALGIKSYITNRIYKVQIHTDGGSAPTIDFDSIGSKSIVRLDGNSAESNELKTDMIAEFLFDGTNMILLNPAELGYIDLIHSESSGTNGGTFTTGSWQTRTLNSEEQDTGNNCVLSSNQFTLKAGTYDIAAIAQTYKVNDHKLRLQNITDASTEILGVNSRGESAFNSHTPAFLSGRFTISAEKTFELQHRCGNTGTTTGFGVAHTFGVNEIYAQIILNKVM